MSGILVVDDDPRIRRLLRGYLEGEGFTVLTAGDGEEMRAMLSRKSFDIVLLDLQLPDANGLDLARELRAESDIGIIILTGKGEVVDRVVGLEIGADDYIAKPFHLREVLARIRSIMRRLKPPKVKKPAKPSGLIKFENWEFDFNKRQLLSCDGQIISLTTGEFNLLCAFINNPGRTLSRDQLLDKTTGRGWEPFDRSIDTQVRRLRQKIEHDPSNPKLVKSVRGVGYVFTPEISQSS